MRILNFQRWKLPPQKISMTFKDSIWKDDILFFTNAKINTLCFSIQMNCKWENFKLKNLLMFEDLTWNLSHSIVICHKTKLLQETFKHLKNFLHENEIWLETYNIGKELFLRHLRFKALNNLKNLSCADFKLQHWNFQQLEELSSTHFLKLECWNSQQFEKHSFTLENLQHFEEVSSTPPIHLEKLQAPCMPPLGNELPLTLQTRKPSFKRILSFFLCNTSSKSFITSCFNTMSFLLFSVGP